MVEGTIFYKAFNSSRTLKTKLRNFDALIGDKYTPDMCGYGIRYF